MGTSQADGDPLIDELEALLEEGAVRDASTPSRDAAASADELAALLPRYRIGTLIGAGGMGRVYDAHDTLLHRRVAIKVVACGGPLVADLMRRERKMLAALQHPGIVAVFDCGELPEGQPYYVMQFVEGLDLRAFVTGRDLSRRQIVDLIIAVARSVGVAHLLKVVHRDLKPSNIKIAADCRPMILDFGLAKFTAMKDWDDGATADVPLFQTAAAGKVKGTLAYMSPEQAAGEPVDSRTDVYALGVILHELLTGRLPRDPQAAASTPHDWSRRLREADRPTTETISAELPMALRAIVEKCLAPAAYDRYPTANELASDLTAYQENRPVSAVRRLRGLYLAQLFARRNRRPIAVAALILAVLATILGMAFVQIREQRNVAQRNAQRAEAEHRLAVDRENATRRYLYAADVGQAHRLWHNRQTGNARSLLNRYLPGKDREDLRTFEWRFVQALCSIRPIRVIHDEDVVALEHAPGGQRVASVDASGKFYLWNTDDGRLQKTFTAAAGPIRAFGILPAGDQLFSIGDDRMLRLWDLNSGRQLRQQWWFWRPLLSVACSPDGKRIALGDKGGWVYFWEPHTGRTLGQLHAHPESARCIRFSPDGKYIATGGKESAVRLWDATTRREVMALEPHQGAVDAIDFSSDAQHVATGGVDRVLRVWNLADPEKPEFVWEAGDEILDVGFGPSPESVWAACKNGTVNFLSTAGPRLQTLHTELVRQRAASVTPELERLASTSGDRSLRLWQAEQLFEYRRVACDQWRIPSRLEYSPSGTWLALAYLNEKHVDVWNMRTGKVARRIDGFEHHVTSLAFSHDESQLLVTDLSNAARLWHVDSWQPGPALPSGMTHRTACAASPVDSRWAVADAGGGVEVLDTTAAHAPLALHGHDNMPIVDVRFSPDGRYLASSGWDKTIHIWELASGRLRHVLLGHQGIVHSVRFSPDGNWLASSSADGTVRLWNWKNGSQQANLWRQAHEILGLCFSHDGRTLAASCADRASGSAEVRMWNMQILHETITLEVGASRIDCLAFAPDDAQLVAGVGPGATGEGLLFWQAAAPDIPQAPKPAVADD